MPQTMLKPAQLLALWRKIKEQYEKGKKPVASSNPGEKQKTRIKTQLNELRTIFRAGDPSNDRDQDEFKRRKREAVRVLKLYCRFLKNFKGSSEFLKTHSEPADRDRFSRFFKAVQRFTVRVLDLEFSGGEAPGDTDEAEADLSELDEVNTADLEQELDRPEEEPATSPEPPPPPAKPPVLQNSIRDEVMRRIQALKPAYLKVCATHGPSSDKVQKLWEGLRQSLKGSLFESAFGLLPVLEREIKAALKLAVEQAAKRDSEQDERSRQKSLQMQTEIREYLENNRDKLMKACGGSGPMADQVRQLWADTQRLLKSGDFQGAFNQLPRLKEQIAFVLSDTPQPKDTRRLKSWEKVSQHSSALQARLRKLEPIPVEAREALESHWSKLDANMKQDLPKDAIATLASIAKIVTDLEKRTQDTGDALGLIRKAIIDLRPRIRRLGTDAVPGSDTADDGLDELMKHVTDRNVGKAKKNLARLQRLVDELEQKAAVAKTRESLRRLVGDLKECAGVDDDIASACRKVSRFAEDRQFEDAARELNDLEQRVVKVKVAKALNEGKYKKGRKLGKGAFGATYLLEGDGLPPLVFKEPVGKGIVVHGMTDPQYEGTMYDAVGDHPNICKSYGEHKINGRKGLVLECISGRTMREVVNDLRTRYAQKEITHEEFWGAVQYITVGTLKAVQHLVAKGISHNDVRPDNIMIDATTGEVKVIDLGIAAKLGSHSGAIPVGHGAPAPDLLHNYKEDKGKVHPVPPGMSENAMTPRDYRLPVKDSKLAEGVPDVFSVGSALYHLVEGLPAFRYGDYLERSRQSGDEEPSETNQFAAAEDYLNNNKRAITPQPQRPGQVSRDVDFDDASGERDATDHNAVRKRLPGRYAENTDYTNFINQLLSARAEDRPVPNELLDDGADGTRAIRAKPARPFLDDGLLPAEAARTILKKAADPDTTESSNCAAKAKAWFRRAVREKKALETTYETVLSQLDPGDANDQKVLKVWDVAVSNVQEILDDKKTLDENVAKLDKALEAWNKEMREAFPNPQTLDNENKKFKEAKKYLNTFAAATRDVFDVLEAARDGLQRASAAHTDTPDAAGFDGSKDVKLSRMVLSGLEGLFREKQMLEQAYAEPLSSLERGNTDDEKIQQEWDKLLTDIAKQEQEKPDLEKEVATYDAELAKPGYDRDLDAVTDTRCSLEERSAAIQKCRNSVFAVRNALLVRMKRKGKGQPVTNAGAAASEPQTNNNLRRPTTHGSAEAQPSIPVGADDEYGLPATDPSLGNNNSRRPTTHGSAEAEPSIPRATDDDYSLHLSDPSSDDAETTVQVPQNNNPPPPANRRWEEALPPRRLDTDDVDREDT
jgi:serine/threonine protein kinase